MTVGESRSAHFAYTPDDSRAYLLLPHRPDEQYPAASRCWRLTGGVGSSAEFRTHEIPPGESTTRLVDCYGVERDGELCLPTGRFRFTTSLALFSVTGGDPNLSIGWGFTVRVA